MTRLFLDRIMSGIEAQDDQDIKPYFRTYSTLLKLRDSLVLERTKDGMTKLLAIMASQQRYYRATEISIDMLTRLAKRHSRVARWLQENRQSCVWMEKWLRGHRGSNGYLQQHQTTLVKPKSCSPWGSVNLSSRGLVKSVNRAIARLLPRLESLFDGAGKMDSSTIAMIIQKDSPENVFALNGLKISGTKAESSDLMKQAMSILLYMMMEIREIIECLIKFLHCGLRERVKLNEFTVIIFNCVVIAQLCDIPTHKNQRAALSLSIDL